LGKVVGEISIDRIKAIMNSSSSNHHAFSLESSCIGTAAAGGTSTTGAEFSSLSSPLTQSEIYAGIDQKESFPREFIVLLVLLT
jgi:hypothetical protein